VTGTRLGSTPGLHRIGRVVRRSYTGRMAELKSVYLVTGDDDAKIDAWRARLRARAESEGGTGALEVFEAAASSPGDVAAALATLSFSTGTRYLLVDGVDAWKAGALEPLESALADMPPDTVLVLIARGKAPGRLADCVRKIAGEVRDYEGPKPWQMAQWAAERAAEVGLTLHNDAAKTLVAAVGGGRPQRVAREVEKLALTAHPKTELSAHEVERFVAGEATAGAYDLADALVAGDRVTALSLAVELRQAEDRLTRLIWPVVRRLREVHRAAGLIESGASEKQIASTLRMPPWAAKRTAAKARRADREGLERALCAFADLEVETRAGGGVDEDTAFTAALSRSAG
jgi:DNA polymerase III subunit delta